MQYRLEKLGNVLKRFEVKLVVGLLLLLIVGLTYKDAAVPSRHESQRYEKMTQENTLAQNSLIATQKRIQDQLNNTRIKTLLLNAAKALPSNVRFDTEVLELNSFFQSSGLQGQALSPGTTNQSGTISGFNISITANGNTASVIRFLRVLQKQVRIRGQNIVASGPIWIVKSITIGAAGSGAGNATGNSSAGSVTIQAVVIFKPVQTNAAASGATTPTGAPASTPTPTPTPGAPSAP